MSPEISFHPPPEDLQLMQGEVHVFCTSLDVSSARIEQLTEILSDDERQRASRFHFGKARGRFVAGRGMLREILGWLLPADPASLMFSYGDHGKPHLAGSEGDKALRFNMAHSDSLAMYAFSRSCEVGVDIERVRPIREAEDIAAHFFSESERTKWRLLPDSAKLEAFFNCWVRKEAVLKARGKGIGEPLNQVEVFFSGNFLADTQFSLCSLFPALSHTAAVAAKCRDLHISCWSLQNCRCF